MAVKLIPMMYIITLVVSICSTGFLWIAFTAWSTWIAARKTKRMIDPKPTTKEYDVDLSMIYQKQQQ